MKLKTKCEDCWKKKECEVFEDNGRFRSQCSDCKKLQVNKYTLLAYKGAIEKAKKQVEAQKSWLNRLGITEEKAIKKIVINYFESIKCSFNEEAFNQNI